MATQISNFFSKKKKSIIFTTYLTRDIETLVSISLKEKICNNFIKFFLIILVFFLSIISSDNLCSVFFLGNLCGVETQVWINYVICQS